MRRMSLPLNRYVNFLWSIPSKCSIVAWRSCTETGCLLQSLVAELVARTDDLPALDACTRHPDGHRPGVMVSAHPALGDRHPPELCMPQDEGRGEEAPCGEIRQ